VSNIDRKGRKEEGKMQRFGLVHRHFVEGVRFDRLESLGRRRSGGNQLAAVRSLREMAEQQERRRVREDEERTRL
jgi:hypothetical protein